MRRLGSGEQKYVLVQMKTYHEQPTESLGTQNKLHNLGCTTMWGGKTKEFKAFLESFDSQYVIEGSGQFRALLSAVSA